MSLAPRETMHLTEDDLILQYYREDDGAGDQRARHLIECSTCGSAYQVLQQVLSAVDDSRPPEPSDGFERIVWARLQPELEKAPSRWFAWGLSPARLVIITVLACVMAGAFFAGRMSRTPTTAVTELAPSDRRERVLLADIGEHLDRSQAMLIELVSGDSGTLTILAERGRAEQLLSDNRLYRQTAAATGNATLITVLDELERVLVDIVASPQAVSASDVDQVRRDIEANGLLFRVRILSSQVRERQRTAIRLRTGQSS
jgi:hypothetical protein